MRYDDFIEDAYKAIREQAPPINGCDRLHEWLLSIGDLLALMPYADRASWIEQYAILIIAKYPHITTAAARVTLKHATDEASGRWPK